MGYFSNGTEGDIYQTQYCSRCIHDAKENCPILAMHLLYNRDQHPEYAKTDEDRGKAIATRDILTYLIPRREDGFNGECRFFKEKGIEEEPPVRLAEVMPAMREWAAERGIR